MPPSFRSSLEKASPQKSLKPSLQREDSLLLLLHPGDGEFHPSGMMLPKILSRGEVVRLREILLPRLDKQRALIEIQRFIIYRHRRRTNERTNEGNGSGQMAISRNSTGGG